MTAFYGTTQFFFSLLFSQEPTVNLEPKEFTPHPHIFLFKFFSKLRDIV